MRYWQTHVSHSGFRDPRSNRDRVTLLKKFAAHDQVVARDIISLPAGFLSTRVERERIGLVDEVRGIADEKDLTIIAGLDLIEDAGWPRVGSADAGTLPFFGFAVGGFTNSPSGWRFWQQTSTSSHDYEGALSWPDRGRELRVRINENTRGLLVLICGELYRADEELHALYEEVRPSLVIVCGHKGMVEPHQSLRRVTQITGATAIISQHFEGPSANFQVAVDGVHMPNKEHTLNLSNGDIWLRARLGRV